MALVSSSSQRRSPTTRCGRAAKFRPTRAPPSTPGEAQRSAVTLRDKRMKEGWERARESGREREGERESR